MRSFRNPSDAAGADAGLVELLAALEQKAVPKGIATSSRRTFVDRVLALLAISRGFRRF